MFEDILEVCTGDLNSQSEETNNFGFGWSQFNSSYTPQTGYESIYNAFQYQDAQTLQTSTLNGKYLSYEGGGYVYELRGKLSYLQGNLSLLKEMEWIDRQTRAIIVEFSVYNPNINIIMVSTILIEFLQSGSILTTARFDPLNLFGEIGSIVSFGNISILVTMIFIVYFMIFQIREIIKVDLYEYLSDFWSYIEWSIIFSAWISFIMFILRLNVAQDVLSFFKTTQGYAYTNLQQVNLYNQILTYSMGLCSSLSSIKFMKMLRFDKNIAFLGLTLKNCFGELVSFSLVFLIIWFAFVQVMYLVYGTYLFGYSSIVKSMETAFQVLLGKADMSEIGNGELKYLGPIIFSFYNIVVIFFALNIFISIITDSFYTIREEAKQHPDRFDFMEHSWNKVKIFFRKKKAEKEHEPKCKEYEDVSDAIDSLVNFVIRVFALLSLIL